MFQLLHYYSRTTVHYSTSRLSRTCKSMLDIDGGGNKRETNLVVGSNAMDCGVMTM